jgi:hypothetical protein
VTNAIDLKRLAVTAATQPATAIAVSEIISAPQGSLRATVEVLWAIADQTDDARVRQAVRYLTGEASDGPPLKHPELIEEAEALVRRGASPWRAATLVASRNSDDTQERSNIQRCVYRGLKKPLP